MRSSIPGRRVGGSCLALLVLVLSSCSSNFIEPEESDLVEEFEPILQPLRLNETANPRRNYFPLHEGDYWVYVVARPSEHAQNSLVRMAEVHIVGSYQMGDRQIFELDNYLFPISDRQTDFCNDDPGQAMEIAGQEVGLWYPWSQFGADQVPIALPEFAEDCVHGSEGVYVGLGTVTVPAGTFEHVATILYNSNPCSDSGFAREVFAPGVGLIERTTLAIGGAITWALVYASVGGRTWGSPPLTCPPQIGPGQKLGFGPDQEAGSKKTRHSTERTYYLWRREYGGLKLEQAKRLRELEKENLRFRRVMADQVLDLSILREVSRENPKPGASTRGCRSWVPRLGSVGASGVSGIRTASLDAARATGVAAG